MNPFIKKLLNKAGEAEEVTAKNASDDFMFDFGLGKKSIKHFRQIIPVQIHHFYVTDGIGDVDPYFNLINTLKTSEQHDTIFININTPGGNLYTALQIISAIKQSAATVVTCMEGLVASAGTMIFLAGHRHMIGPNSSFMAHNYSGYSHGKGNELKTRQEFDERNFLQLMRDIYTGFLTETEILALMEDRDVWLTADEVAKRIPNKLIGIPGPQEDTQSLLAALLGGGDMLLPEEVAQVAPAVAEKKKRAPAKAKPKVDAPKKTKKPKVVKPASK